MVKSKVLFWYDEATKGPTYTWLDRYITYFGLEMRPIDLVGQFKQEPGRLPIAYQNLISAIEDMRDHRWVILDASGNTILDEYEHPKTPAVYALGSDTAGFGGPANEVFKGLDTDFIRLRKEGEVYVQHLLPILLYDRELSIMGKR
jgi:hypothetical protein